jgi:hypothetical protein
MRSWPQFQRILFDTLFWCPAIAEVVTAVSIKITVLLYVTPCTMLRKSNISDERAASNFLYPDSVDQVRRKCCYTLTELHGFRYLKKATFNIY